MADDTANPLNVPYGYCYCGCGQKTNIAIKNDPRHGNVIGQPYRYLMNHDKRSPKFSLAPPNPSGCCMCGCGQKTELAKFNDTHAGMVKGEHLRTIRGHKAHSTPRYIVNEETGCWEWQRALNNSGYGLMGNRGSTRQAHRIYYEQRFGPIPEGLQIDHLCRNRRCVNPDHLEAVTPRENLRRGKLPKLTAEQVREIKSLFGTMSCSAIARRFGMGPSAIRSIRDGLTWKDVE